MKDFSDLLFSIPQDFRIAETPIFAVAGVLPGGFQQIQVEPCRIHPGICFSLKCSLEECGKLLLKRISDLCITVSVSFSRAIRVLRFHITTAVHAFVQKVSTARYLSFCVFRR